MKSKKKNPCHDFDVALVGGSEIKVINHPSPAAALQDSDWLEIPCLSDQQDAGRMGTVGSSPHSALTGIL